MAFFEFPHTRTYDSDLAWLIKAYKILTGKVDNIEQTIEDTINDALKGEELNQLITQLIAESLLLNVKYPPAESGLTPAVGDGETDDTAALQAMIAYSSAHDMPLLFPAGTYRVSGLNVDVDTVFMGFASTLMLMNVSSAPLLNVSAKFACFGMTLNANIGGQTQPQNVISCMSGRFIIDHCHISSGLSGITGNVTGDCRLVNSEISNFSEYGLYLEGTGRIVSTGVDIPNVASGGALRFIRLDVSNSYIDAWESVAEISVGVEITGDNNYVSVNFPNVETPVNDGGQNNNWEVVGKSEKRYFNGTAYHNYQNLQETVEGDITQTVEGDITQTVEDFDGVASGHYSLSGKDISLNPSNPLTYKTPSEFSKFYDSIKFKDSAGSVYNVLVANALTNSIGTEGAEGFYNITDMGAVGDGVTDDTEIFKELNNKNGIIFVPKGEYVFNDEYTINNVIIIFDPEAKMLLKNSGTNIVFNNAVIFNGIFEDEAESVTGGALLVLDGMSEIHNATFNCHNANRLAASAEQGSNSKFVNCKFYGNSTAPFGLHCDRSGNTCKLIVENCEFHDFLLNGIFSSALLGLYRNCYFSGNHKQTEPTGGGQIDVLSNSNTPSHSIVGCLFENSGGVNTPGIETFQTDVLIEGCYIDSSGANYGITLQQGKHSTVIGNHFKTNKVCVFIDSGSSGNFFGNIFVNTNQPPITCAAENANGCVCYGNIIDGENQTLFNYTSDNVGMYYVIGEKNNTTFSLNANQSVNINVGDAQNKNVMFTIDVNDSQAILLISEFGSLTWIPSAPSNLNASYSNNILTLTNNGSGEHRYNIVKK